MKKTRPAKTPMGEGLLKDPGFVRTHSVIPAKAGIHVHRNPCSQESMFTGVIPRSVNLPCHPEERQPPVSSLGASTSRVIPRSVGDEGSAVENTDGRMA
jgi:hypothetical protein